MTPAQLEQLSALLAEEAASARYVLTSLGRMAAMQGVLEKGSWSQEELLNAPRDPSNPVRKLLESAPAASAEPEQSK
jgi:hypothetical protein